MNFKSMLSTRSRGSNKRSFNIMTTKGSSNKAFKFGESRANEAARQSLRIPTSNGRGTLSGE
jgi:hypothetical protein